MSMRSIQIPSCTDQALRCNTVNSRPNTETEAYKIVQCQTEAFRLTVIYNPTEVSALRWTTRGRDTQPMINSSILFMFFSPWIKLILLSMRDDATGCPLNFSIHQCVKHQGESSNDNPNPHVWPPSEFLS